MKDLKSRRLDPGLGVLKNVPKDILSKLGISYDVSILQEPVVEVAIISGGSPEELRILVENLGGKYEDLGYGFGIVNVPANMIWRLASINLIQYIEIPKNLYTTDFQSNRAACVNVARQSFGIEGEGVMIGFIDSGIDYTHLAFRNLDGTTRIDYIYDLNEGGKIYNREDINTALRSPDPFSVVSSYDNTEHGTHVAGIACAGGSISPNAYGVAPKSSIAMVKCTRGRYALSTDIMKGIRFLIDRAREIRKLLVVNISLSTNDGAHNGTSLLEQYISTVATLERITIVIAAGNEGDAAHHVGGNLIGGRSISINIADDEPSVILNLYKPVLSDIAIKITSPTAATSGSVIIREGYNEGIIGKDRYQLFYTGPKPFDIIGEISIALVTGGEFISPGQWEIEIILLNEYTGPFDMWLPISEGLNINTKFLQPTVLNTLGIPATVENIIAVGSYDYVTNNISSFSGRGREATFNYMRPDLVAPGENISAPVPNGGFDVKSGTSMASPHVAGIAALMMEWGIVKGNDPYLYGERLKYYLIKSAKRPRVDVSYPDPSWGYGQVCLNEALDVVIKNIGFMGRESTRNYTGVIDELNNKNLDEIELSREKQKEVSILKDFDTETFQKYRDYTRVVNILVEYTSRERVSEINNIIGASVIILDGTLAIVRIPFNRVLEVEPYVNDIYSFQIPAIYTLAQSSPIEASEAPLFHRNPLIQLDGGGVIVAIVDSGIDYLNPEFMREDGTTRILRIWDQTLDMEDENGVYSVKVGVEYKEEQINNAIQAKNNGQDPYSIVKTKDDIGHGTMVASIAGARGINPELTGVAPNCDFVVIKLMEASEILLDYAGMGNIPGSGRYETLTLLLCIRYLSLVISELSRPTVVCFALGTNTGSHDGRNLLEGSFGGITARGGVVPVTGTGNEGDTDTHTEGRFSISGERKTIEVRVGKGQRDLSFQIYIAKPDKVSIGVTSPSGEVIERIPVRLNRIEKVTFIYEGTRMRISYVYPDIYTGDEIINIEARGIREGIWQFKLYGDYIVDGRYWGWLPQRELLDPNTKFLSPTQYSTLTIPGTSYRVITAAFYNQNNNATVGQSGRGYTRDGRIKPDIAAGGINALVTTPGGGTRVVSGSSVATAVTAGCCALILDWAVVKGNDPGLYATEVHSYLIRGTNMRIGDVYPNEQWGYGTISMTGVFNAIRESSQRNK